METAAPEDPRPAYLKELTCTLKELEKGNRRLRVPRPSDLFRRRPRSHFHSTPELFIQTGGATDFECPGEKFRLGTGELCIMGRGIPHAETPKDLETPYGILVLTHIQDGMILLRCNSGPSRRIHGLDSIEIKGPRGRDSFFLLDEIVASEELSQDIQDDYRRQLAQTFILTAIAELRRSAKDPAITVPGNPLAKEAERLARTSLANPQLKVSWLATSLGCSPDHLSRCFHKEFGISLSTWICRERIQLSKELLKDSKYNISEIGWACGFNGTSYFIKVFQRHTGLTPRAYRVSIPTNQGNSRNFDIA